MAKYFTDGSSTIGIKSAYCVTDEKGHVLEIVESKLSSGNPCFTNNAGSC